VSSVKATEGLEDRNPSSVVGTPRQVAETRALGGKHFREKEKEGSLCVWSIIVCANHWYENTCKGISKEHLTTKIISRNLLNSLLS
jgi:hypothetical protein